MIADAVLPTFGRPSTCDNMRKTTKEHHISFGFKFQGLFLLLLILFARSASWYQQVFVMFLHYWVPTMTFQRREVQPDGSLFVEKSDQNIRLKPEMSASPSPSQACIATLRWQDFEESCHALWVPLEMFVALHCLSKGFEFVEHQDAPSSSDIVAHGFVDLTDLTAWYS